MKSDSPEDLRYPIGKFQFPAEVDPQTIEMLIGEVDAFPEALERLIADLNEEQLDSPYRPGGWTVRQVVHHIGDSHMGSFTRFKWALTEDNPTIKAYDQDAWIKLSDSNGPVPDGIAFIKALHRKWVDLMRSLTEEQWNKTFVHPETGKKVLLKQNLALYVWHGRHHYAHIKNSLTSENRK